MRKPGVLCKSVKGFDEQIMPLFLGSKTERGEDECKPTEAGLEYSNRVRENGKHE